MLLARTTSGIDLLPTSVATAAPFATPEPPARWARWYTSPIARIDYGTGSRMPLFHEARIPADRGLMGELRPTLTYGGASKEAAIEAARLLAATPVQVEFSFRNGRTRSVEVHPAIAVLRDAKAGAYWLAPLQTTVQLRGEWLDAPHSIDGPAFGGDDAVLRTPSILSATRDMVAVVGRDSVIVPGRWTSAPADSIVRS
ncbi:MAG: hypothetical protein JWM86_2345 [Thermoleophilia bacterium]|nr:hypothetical protein [Thermoleophilia bacterium]